MSSQLDASEAFISGLQNRIDKNNRYFCRPNYFYTFYSKIVEKKTTEKGKDSCAICLFIL